MIRQEPPAGASATVERVVVEADLASSFTPARTDAFPRVLATARMVALMEIAASRVLEPVLSSGEMSVGVSLETTHTAATPEGSTVRTHARYTGRDGKFYAFEIWAEDGAGEIGRGRHSRAVVEAARLEASAAKRRHADKDKR